MRVQGVLRNRDLLYFLCRHLCKIHSYTDVHDVNEDRMTISNYGVWWYTGDNVGVMQRTMLHAPTDGDTNVASSNIRN